MNRIPLLVPRMPRSEALLPYLKQIDANRRYTNFGPLNDQLEERILADMGQGQARANITTVANCTVGLELALQALGLPAGARVLIPAITFVATATAVVRAGMVPVISDVDPDTWVLTPEIARRAHVAGLCNVVMPVSTFGYAHDAAAWDAFVRETGIPVVIDAAGAYGNQRGGQLTDVVFSFHATKSFGAGEGGAVLSSHPERIASIRKLSNFGIDTSIGQLDGLGTNGKMSEYHCAVGLASFDEWDDTRRRRRCLHDLYLAALRRHCPALVFQAKDETGVYPLMPVLLPEPFKANNVMARLSAEGIETRRWYCPSLSIHPALTQAARAGALDVANSIGERILGLPFFIDLSSEQVEHICTRLAAILSGEASA